MKLVPQLVAIALIVAIATPLAARFVPGTHPWLDRVGLLAPLSAVGVVPVSTAEASGTAPRGGQRQGAGVQVIASEAERRVLSNIIDAIGSARGAQSVALSFGVTGRVTALRTAPGQQVAAGEVLAELDAENARLSVERARLMLADAQQTIDRLAQLAGSGTTTSLQRQDAELALRTAELGLQSAERDLADHSLTAPVAGYVGLIEPQIGDLVTPSTTITRIEDRSNLIVDFRVPERIAAQVAPGAIVVATPISNPGHAIEGRVSAVDNRVDEASRTLRVQASIANPDDRLRAGMAFRITLEFTGAEVPAVSPLAIQWGADGAFVWVVRTAKATRLPIRILQRNADAVLIDAELQPGDLVVTEGVQALRPGAEVSLAPPRS
ncbi:MAG: efflux RND transporter periplasmic adaptor subunit [Pseudotabrizicola sp.]|uniref:efflux RND transporter periplasmic adaptor subunit n=1 Tax=Pseudotabrizicola sp. TaxID=2939647 RepID=UPI0027302C0F|nr:efflux RND transporter periplasmic adaptor subunit [Pseudotabrizicola sp.]MDP2081944.1 efflux RND transporter periplasmic adaptor subunit [Pseudotabrizicola sp.]MDZ7576016.1 efflux RND transporter periplasmic adaptor subunit [Pseudotabrizicola sp.]